MAHGTIRYWAAAKAAAGVAEERYDAPTLAAALDAVRRRHADDPAFGRVLDRCSFVVDDAPVGRRDHASVLLADGAVVEVLPPFAGGAAGVARPETAPRPPGRRAHARPAHHDDVRRHHAHRAAHPVDRWAGGAALVTAGLLGLASVAGVWVLALAVALLQAALAVAWAALTASTGHGSRPEVTALVLLAGLGADGAMLAADGEPSLRPMAGVLSVVFLAALALALVRRDHGPGTTTTVAATSTGAAVAVLAAAYLAAHESRGGAVVVVVSVAALGLTTTAAALRVPRAVHALLAGGLGGLAGGLLGLGRDVVGLVHGAYLGVGAALVGAVGVAVVGYAVPRREESGPAYAVVPLALGAPAAYVLGRLVVG